MYEELGTSAPDIKVALELCVAELLGSGTLHSLIIAPRLNSDVWMGQAYPTKSEGAGLFDVRRRGLWTVS